MPRSSDIARPLLAAHSPKSFHGFGSANCSPLNPAMNRPPRISPRFGAAKDLQKIVPPGADVSRSSSSRQKIPYRRTYCCAQNSTLLPWTVPEFSRRGPPSSRVRRRLPPPPPGVFLPLRFAAGQRTPGCKRVGCDQTAATSCHKPSSTSDGRWRVPAVISGKKEARVFAGNQECCATAQRSAVSSAGTSSSSQGISSRIPSPTGALRVKPGRRDGISACVARRRHLPQTTSNRPRHRLSRNSGSYSATLARSISSSRMPPRLRSPGAGQRSPELRGYLQLRSRSCMLPLKKKSEKGGWSTGSISLRRCAMVALWIRARIRRSQNSSPAPSEKKPRRTRLRLRVESRRRGHRLIGNPRVAARPAAVTGPLTSTSPDHCEKPVVIHSSRRRDRDHALRFCCAQ